MSTLSGMPASSTTRPPQNLQGQHAMDNNNGSDEYGVSVRPMRLKVLYTFDDQNKTNCLARWPHVLSIKTIAMDEMTSIGVIELRTCIQAIVECSPELVARLGQDYTVYAYDYSEYDNPLVGQGMLSWALAAAAPTPDAPAHQSQKLITGRVCKNILGLFANGVKETLEVKLRLVPVPTVLQSEYLNTMEKYREMSRAAPPGLSQDEWTAFMQSNSESAATNKTANTARSNSAHREGMSMEVFNQLLSPTMQQPSIDPLHHSGSIENFSKEVQGGSSNGTTGKKTSRPSSRASVKRPRAKPRAKKDAAAQGGNTSGYEEGTDGDEGPAPKKRAKITKTDWNSKSSFGAAPDSLRVAASTAGSLRLFRPIAISPATNAGSHLQEVPRAPTPVPNRREQQLGRQRTLSQSSLGHPSFASQIEAPRKHVSPYPRLEANEDQVRLSIESAGPSPERNSPNDFPHDIASSPPVMATVSPMRSSPPCPSSPELPHMPRTDSGFMSGSLEELFGLDENDFQTAEDEEFDLPQDHSRRPPTRPPPAPETSELIIHEVTPGPVDLLPRRMPVFEAPRLPRAKSTCRAISRIPNNVQAVVQSAVPQAQNSHIESQAAQSPVQEMSALPPPAEFQPVSPQLPEPRPATTEPVAIPAAPQPRPASRGMQRTASVGSLNLPAVAASDPVLPPSNLQRSETWSEAPHPVTEVPAATRSTSDDGAPRPFAAKKAAIRQRLEQAIANGETPPYCYNCGAIETPTWRKAWSQEIRGAPAYYEYSDEPGRVTIINIVERDSEGNPTVHQIVKKFLSPEEKQEDFKEYLLCNPCGIWMSKYKTQRPEERWEINRLPKDAPEKRAPERKRPSQRRVKKVQPGNPPEQPSEANFPQSEANFPQSEAVGQHEGISPEDTTNFPDSQTLIEKDSNPIEQRRRSTSARPIKRLHAMTSDAASAALRRAIQSSPARWAGTQHSPIAIDEDDLGSTRRLLFPSPRKDGSPKVLGVMTANAVQFAPDFRTPKSQVAEAPNKENCPPSFRGDDCDADFMRLFEEETARPKTPIHNSTAPNPFKTPTRPTPNHRPITRSVSKSMQSGKSPRDTLGVSHRTPLRTPRSSAVRRSPRNHLVVFESPFTASLNQLISEANEHSYQNLELDFSNLPQLPDLDGAAHHPGHADINFNLEDFFSTDVPMPSSPPRMFQLYEDPLAMANVDWNEFSEFDASVVEKDGGSGEADRESAEIQVKEEPALTPKDGEQEVDDASNLVDFQKLS